MELDEQLGVHNGAPWGDEDDEDEDDLEAKQKKLQDSTTAMIEYGMELKQEFANDQRREVKRALEDTFALIAYENVRESSLAPLLETSGRVPVAEELNSAILGESARVGGPIRRWLTNVFSEPGQVKLCRAGAPSTADGSAGLGARRRRRARRIHQRAKGLSAMKCNSSTSHVSYSTILSDQRRSFACILRSACIYKAPSFVPCLSPAGLAFRKG